MSKIPCNRLRNTSEINLLKYVNQIQNQNIVAYHLVFALSV